MTAPSISEANWRMLVFIHDRFDVVFHPSVELPDRSWKPRGVL